MKDFLTYIIQGLVDNPREVKVNEIEGDKTSVIELRVGNGDVGRIIGRQGSVIKAIRLLSNAIAVKHGKKVTVEVIG
ncbi:MAG: KH domain-containing protein [bacterium]|nr:KH domain-containing protein [bacterium]